MCVHEDEDKHFLLPTIFPPVKSIPERIAAILRKTEQNGNVLQHDVHHVILDPLQDFLNS